MQTLKRKFAALVAGCASLLATAALAQDPGTTGGTSSSSTTTTTVTTWYSEPWVWLVAGGIAVFLIVVIALTNRGGTSRSA